MNWLRKYTNHILAFTATAVGTAGAIVAAAASGVGIPVAVVGIASKVVAYGTTVGIIAAKVLPGTGKNNPNGSVIDREEPK
jgi:hypothetical protein